MAENLFIRQVGERLEWLVMDEGTKSVRVRGKGTAAEFESLMAEIHFEGRSILLVPSEQVLLTRATVPSKQLRQVMQAIPFMVEESLAQDIEDCHFAIGRRGAGGQVDVCVVDRDLMQGLLSRLESVSIAPVALVPDVLAVPVAGGGIDVVVSDNRALVRTGSGQGVSVALSMLPMTLSLFDAAERITIHVHPASRQAFEMYLAQIQAAYDGELNVLALDVEPFEFLCAHLEEDAINLLQGEFQVVEEKTDRRSGWRVAAMLVACAFGLHIMLLVGQGIYLDVKASQYEAEARLLYASVFPADKNVRDIRRRWQAHIGSGSQGTGEFFELFSEAARLLPNSRLIVQNVNFNESRGDLILQMTAPESEQFVVFAQTLTQAGLAAEVGTINQDAEVARGSIKVKMAGDS